MSWFFPLNQIDQRVGKTKDRSSIHSFGIIKRSFTQAEVGSVDKCESIEEEEAFVGHEESGDVGLE